MAGQSAKMGPVLRGEISNTQSRPLNGHPPSYIYIAVATPDGKKPKEEEEDIYFSSGLKCLQSMG